jgi:hypothetical protein
MHMNRSNNNAVLGKVVAHSFWRTIYGYLLFLAAVFLFPIIPGLQNYAGNWSLFLFAALLLHGLYFINTLNNPPLLRRMLNEDRPAAPQQEDIRLDQSRRLYLDDLKNRRQIIGERVAQMQDIPSLAADMNAMVADLDRLVPELEGLLKRNQRLETDIKRFESTNATARPSAESLKELRELYGRQWDVVKRVTGEVATFDANLAIMVNQYDSQRDAEQLDAQIKEWSGSLSVWKDSIRQVYGQELGSGS